MKAQKTKQPKTKRWTNSVGTLRNLGDARLAKAREQVFRIPKRKQKQRTKFEAWVACWPYERDVSRWPMGGTTPWPGQYKDYAVQLAWESWQAAIARSRENDT